MLLSVPSLALGAVSALLVLGFRASEDRSVRRAFGLALSLSSLSLFATGPACALLPLDPDADESDLVVWLAACATVVAAHVLGLRSAREAWARRLFGTCIFVGTVVAVGGSAFLLVVASGGPDPYAAGAAAVGGLFVGATAGSVVAAAVTLLAVRLVRPREGREKKRGTSPDRRPRGRCPLHRGAGRARPRRRARGAPRAHEERGRGAMPMRSRASGRRWLVLAMGGLTCAVACGSATRVGDDAGRDAGSDGEAEEDASLDDCAAMDAREGPDTCDGGGWGYRWNGEGCVYQGDLCNCLGADCGRLYATVEACREAFAHCAAADCDLLREALVVAFEAAVWCDPAMSSLLCDGSEMMTNACGCPWAANNRTPDLARAAREAWEPYSAAGCVPETCGPCREPTPTFHCTALPVGTGGTCEMVLR